jgi:hypothetical protein
LKNAAVSPPELLEISSPFDNKTNTLHDSFSERLKTKARNIITTSIEFVAKGGVSDKSDYTSRLIEISESYHQTLEAYGRASSLAIRKPSSFDGRTQSEGDRAALLLDGELDQLNELTNNLSEYTLKSGFDLLKLAGGTSPTQQPNDVMPCFRTLKQFLKSPQYKSLQAKLVSNSNKPHHMDRLETILAPLAPASRATYLKAFQVLPNILSTAYSVTNVQKGWACVDHTNLRGILEKCPAWEKLSEKHQEEVIAAIPELAKDAIYGIGTPSDEKMDELLDHIIGPVSLTAPSEDGEAHEADDEEMEKGKEDEADDDDDEDGGDDDADRAVNTEANPMKRKASELVLNRWRATVISCPASRYHTQLRLAITELKTAHAKLKKVIKDAGPEVKAKAAEDAEAKKAAAAALAALKEPNPICSNKGVLCLYTGKVVEVCSTARCSIQFCKKCVDGGYMKQHRTCVHKEKT